MAKIPPLKMNTVTISSKNKSCQVTNLDFQANSSKIWYRGVPDPAGYSRVLKPHWGSAFSPSIWENPSKQ